MRRVRYVLIGIGAIVLLAAMVMFRGMGTVKNLDIGVVDLGSVADGTYRGEYKYARWSYTADVTVRDHKIVDVKLVDDKNKVMEKASMELISKIASQGTLKVDTVSGATVTSKALLKAVENALTSASK